MANAQVIQALSVLQCFLVLFKFFGRHRQTGILVATLTQAASGIATFFGVGMIVYFAFGFAGTTLFGEMNKDWCSMGNSLNTLFMMIMGDYGMSDMKKMNTSSWHVVAFYYCHIAVVYCVLFNMLLAIVMEAYVKVQRKNAYENE